jgi:hypothetical protein
MPTEALPPIYSPPPPSYYPTSSFSIPDIPLSFQIDQHGIGHWSLMPTVDANKILKITIAKITSRENIYVSNFQFKATQKHKRRILKETGFILNYTITTTLAKKDNPNIIYTSLKGQLESSVNNGTFNAYLKQEGVPINVTSITCSPYILVLAAYNSPTFKPTFKPSAVNSTTVNGNVPPENNQIIGQDNLTIIIILVSNCTFFIIATLLYIHYRKNQRAVTASETATQITEPREVSLVNANAPTTRRTLLDEIPNPLQKRLPVE